MILQVKSKALLCSANSIYGNVIFHMFKFGNLNLHINKEKKLICNSFVGFAIAFQSKLEFHLDKY